MPARGPARGMLGAAAPAAQSEVVARTSETEAPRAVADFAELIALAGQKRDLGLKSALERDVRLVRFEDGRLEIALEANARKTLVGELSKKLAEWTGRRWMVIVSTEAGAPSVHAQAEMRKAELKDSLRSDPLVQAVLTQFPGAEIVGVRPAAMPPAGISDEVPETLPAESDPADDQ